MCLSDHFLMRDKIKELFHLDLDENQRKVNYDYLETFIEKNVSSWDNPPNTELIESLLTRELKNFSDFELAFLLVHSGYMPEFYSHDSSQETLYSKLVESLICEWANRIGFTDSFLQTQKSNKEDITIKLGNCVIVCDAKSSRLGRSQSAPNVKDTIKQASYIGWLDQYKINNCRAGIITFPSLMDWKKGSEAYKYFTDKSLPILFLFYEHLSFILLSQNLNHQSIIDFIHDYSTIFPNSTSDKQVYSEGLKKLFPDKLYVELKLFLDLSDLIIREKVLHSINRIKVKALTIRQRIEEDISKSDFGEVRKIAVDAVFKNKYGQILKQLKNIEKFRLP
ncbi:hypothetical protein ES702_06165 [subsurface metagenome]